MAVVINLFLPDRWELIFVFVFVTGLFVFEYERPAFALLFALPPKYTPRGHATVLLLVLFKVIARTCGAHRDTSREGFTLFYFPEHVLYF